MNNGNDGTDLIKKDDNKEVVDNTSKAMSKIVEGRPKSEANMLAAVGVGASFIGGMVVDYFAEKKERNTAVYENYVKQQELDNERQKLENEKLALQLEILKLEQGKDGE